MRTRVSTVQLAILDTKQVRARALQQEIDQLHRQVEEILHLETDFEKVTSEDAIATFLNGEHTPAELLAVLGMEVES